jgi:hypothetical protein
VLPPPADYPRSTGAYALLASTEQDLVVGDHFDLFLVLNRFDKWIVKIDEK